MYPSRSTENVLKTTFFFFNRAEGHLCKIKETESCKSPQRAIASVCFSLSCLPISLGYLRKSGRRDLKGPRRGRSPPALETGVLGSFGMSVQPRSSLPETKGLKFC